jgi:hypothetical protein
VTVVETFLNALFRVVVSESQFEKHAQLVLADLKKRRSLDYKLRTWPNKVLGKSLNFEAPGPKAFLALKERRNDLVHFTSSHETVIVPGVQIRGLADTSAFDDLALIHATRALEAAEEMVRELFRLRGIREVQLPLALHAWTGKPALSESN